MYITICQINRNFVPNNNKKNKYLPQLDFILYRIRTKYYRIAYNKFSQKKKRKITWHRCNSFL